VYADNKLLRDNAVGSKDDKELFIQPTIAEENFTGN